MIQWKFRRAFLIVITPQRIHFGTVWQWTFFTPERTRIWSSELGRHRLTDRVSSERWRKVSAPAWLRSQKDRALKELRRKKRCQSLMPTQKRGALAARLTRMQSCCRNRAFHPPKRTQFCKQCKRSTSQWASWSKIHRLINSVSISRAFYSKVIWMLTATLTNQWESRRVPSLMHLIKFEHKAQYQLA